MSNWVEKTTEEIEKQINNWQFTGLPGEARRRKAFADIILSHAPVIDAEGLADKILLAGFKKYERSPDDKLTATEVTLFISQEIEEIAQLISGSIDAPCVPTKKE